MLVLNFSHPLTVEQLAQITALTAQPVSRVIDVPVQFDPTRPFAEQVAEMLERVALLPTAWQTLPLLINLPGHAPIAAVLLAELHGRMGYFPAMLRLRAVPERIPTQFEVAEIINLQTVRERARQQRSRESDPA